MGFPNDFKWDIDKRGQNYDPNTISGTNFWNYYITYLSLLAHLIIMVFALDCWCRWSKILLFYSFQVLLLHGFSWAIPNRSYAYWIKDKSVFFYVLSGLNIIGYVCSIAAGILMYTTSSNTGLVKFFGVSLLFYTLISQSLMIVMFTMNYISLSRRFDYEEIPIEEPQQVDPIV